MDTNEPESDKVDRSLCFAKSRDCGRVRWGDYSMTTIDPADNVSFWHTNESYATTGIIWSTKVGKFQFPAQTPTPPPRP